jgi:hypothetical protein
VAGRREAARAEALGRAATAAVGIGGVLLVGRTVGLHLPACPLRTITGVPCPGCGVTRLADAVAHGRVGEALGADPLGVALLAAVATLAVVAVIARARGASLPARVGSWPVVGVLAALVGLRWLDAVATGLPAL